MFSLLSCYCFTVSCKNIKNYINDHKTHRLFVLLFRPQGSFSQDPGEISVLILQSPGAGMRIETIKPVPEMKDCRKHEEIKVLSPGLTQDPDPLHLDGVLPKPPCTHTLSMHGPIDDLLH